MKILFAYALAFTLFCECTNAQTFQKSIGRTGNDYPLHMIEVTGGGYVVSGTTGEDNTTMRQPTTSQNLN